MTALATLQDVETRLGRSLSASEQTRATALLEDASALVVGITGQKFLPSNSVNLLRLNGTKLWLPQRPATAVNSVETVDGDAVPYHYDGFQTLTFEPSDIYDIAMLVVDYDHGTVTVPNDVVGVVAGMVARTISIPAEAAAGVTSQAVGPYSVQYAAWAVGGQVMASPADREVLKRYNIKMVGAIDLIGD